MRGLPLILGAFFLHACGGGSSGGDDTPPENRAPAITSPASVSVTENTAGTFYQAAASDPDGNAVSFSLGGSDGFRFAITAAGALSFAAPVDFETPVDADADNIYRVQLVASDGTLQTTADLAITVTNLPDATALRLLGEYDRPVQIASVPGSARLFVAEQDGRILIADPAVAGPGAVYLTVTDLFSRNASDHGVLGIAAAPDFAASGRLYVFVTSGARDFEIRRYGRTAGGTGDPASMDVIFRATVPSPFSPVFFEDLLGGTLVFGPDNYLYVGVGSAGATGSLERTQDLTGPYGKILRLDVSRDDFPGDANRDYGIPAGNPFAAGGGAPEIFAYGLRNPRRANFDGSTLLIGDAQRPGVATGPFCCPQRIFMLRPQDAGANFGYGLAEGAPGTLPPVIRYESGRAGGLVTAGYVYRGPDPQLNGRYIFGDAVLEFAWSVPAASLVQGTTIGLGAFRGEPALMPSASANSQGIFGFAMDSGNNLFLLSRDFLAGPGVRGSVYAVEYR